MATKTLSAETRRARRASVNCLLVLSGDEDFQAEAQALDLSTTGCRAESETPVEVGMMLRVSISLEDFPWPVTIERAIVRWVDGYTFGLEYDVILPAQRDRLRKLVTKSRPR